MVYRRAKRKHLINVYMTFEIVFVLLSLLGMVAALVADKMRPGVILFGSGLVFVCRYSDPENAWKGSVIRA